MTASNRPVDITIPRHRLVDLIDDMHAVRYLVDAAFLAAAHKSVDKMATDALQAVLGQASDLLDNEAGKLMELLPEGDA